MGMILRTTESGAKQHMTCAMHVDVVHIKNKVIRN